MLSPIWSEGLEQAYDDAYARHFAAIDAEDGPAILATCLEIEAARKALYAAEREAEFDRR